jgi:hypothetical protein
MVGGKVRYDVRSNGEVEENRTYSGDISIRLLFAKTGGAAKRTCTYERTFYIK